MNYYYLAIAALAVSLDAFAVALSIGLEKGVRLKDKFRFSFSFGFFQFLLCFLGAIVGIILNTYVVSVPKVIGGIIISIVGIIMLKEGFENKEEQFILKPCIAIILGVSVSIDSAIIGFTLLSSIGSMYYLVKVTIFIGLVTLVMSIIAFSIAKLLKRISIVEKYAKYIGGVILIAFGIKMMF